MKILSRTVPHNRQETNAGGGVFLAKVIRRPQPQHPKVRRKSISKIRRTFKGYKLKGRLEMADFAAMYRKLFNSQTQAIELLQKAQQDTEEMYVSAPDPDIRVLDTSKENNGENE